MWYTLQATETGMSTITQHGAILAATLLFATCGSALETNGLKVTFVLAKTEFMIGEPVECKCVIENTSDKDLFYGAHGPPGDVEMEVIESPKGTKLRRPYTSLGGATVPVQLKRGEVARLPFLLNPFVWFTKPGTYKLRITFVVRRADNREMKNGSYHCADQTLSLNCRAQRTGEFHAMMEGLVKQAIEGRDGEWRSAVYKLSVIGLPESAAYIRKCLRATDYSVRERMISECAGDLLEGLRDIGGPVAKEAIEEVIAEAKLNEDNWRWRREYAENVLHRMLTRPDLKRPEP